MDTLWANSHADSASHIPAGNVLVSLTAFTVIYILLLIAYLYFGSRIIRRGPKFDLPVLGVEPTKPAVNTTPGVRSRRAPRRTTVGRIGDAQLFSAASLVWYSSLFCSLCNVGWF